MDHNLSLFCNTFPSPAAKQAGFMSAYENGRPPLKAEITITLGNNIEKYFR